MNLEDVQKAILGGEHFVSCESSAVLNVPMVLDMATTEIPFFEIKNAKEKGTPLRSHVAVNSHGRPTTVAKEALSEDGVANLLPIGGGFKGFGITLLIEVLTGSLVQSLLSTAQAPGWHPHEYGSQV